MSDIFGPPPKEPRCKCGHFADSHREPIWFGGPKCMWCSCTKFREEPTGP